MPSVSSKQRRYLFATKGAAWVKAHGFDVLDTARKQAHKKRRHK